jgi:hypothetical protein
MKENVTVKESISKGRLKLIYLPIILVLSFIGLGIYLKTIELIEDWMIAVFVLLGFLLAWLAWSYFVVEWKIWAFENVRNVHELKRKAIQNNLIWKEGSWFNKTEIINYEQKQKLKHLERKFLEKDVFYDDLNISKETLIYYSKGIIVFGFIFGIGAVGFSIYSFLENATNYVYLLFVGLGAFFLYQSIVKIISKSPQLEINSRGIKFAKTTLMEWKFINNEFVDIRRSGKHVSHYLVFNYQNSHQEIRIDDLGTNLEKLEKLLQVYRVRFEKKPV